MWPSGLPARIAVIIIVLVITYSFVNNVTRPRPGVVARPPDPTEQLDVNAVRMFETGHKARLTLSGLNGSVSIKTGRPQEATVERRSQTPPGKLDGPAATLPVHAQGSSVTLGRELHTPGLFGIFPGETRAPVAADLRITVADDAAVDLVDFDGKVTITAVQGGVTIRGGNVNADLTNLGSRGLTVDIKAGQVSIEGAGGTCGLSLGNATLTAMQLSCQELNVESRRSVYVEDGSALGIVKLATDSGSITVARVRADQLTATSNSGAIEFTDSTVDGTMTVQATAGDVTLARLGAEQLHITANRGSVALGDVRGEMDITAGKADITLRRITTPRLTVQGGGGEVQVSGNLQSAKGKGHEIKTTGGAVTVYLAKEASLALNADAGAGRVTVDPAFQAPSGRSLLKTEIHGGSTPLTITSGGGAIRLLTGQPMF